MPSITVNELIHQLISAVNKDKRVGDFKIEATSDEAEVSFRIGGISVSINDKEVELIEAPDAIQEGLENIRMK